MKTEAIVASAGVGKRLTQPFYGRAGLRTRVRKPYLNLLGKPILIHTLQALSNSKDINSVIVVVHRLDKKRCEGYIKRYGVEKIKAVVVGGEHRFNSVRNGLGFLDKNTDIALVHDGVRPFIDKDIIKRSIDCANKTGACVVAVPIKATVKSVDCRRSTVDSAGIVEKTIDRSSLWEIQTPQAFRKDLIVKAYRSYAGSDITDDAVLVERLGVKVRIVMGSYGNIKITTPEDLVAAEAILKNQKSKNF